MLDGDGKCKCKLSDLSAPKFVKVESAVLVLMVMEHGTEFLNGKCKPLGGSSSLELNLKLKKDKTTQEKRRSHKNRY